MEKVIKLANSAYRIIDFFPESDPLKGKAKEKVLSIMDNLTILELTDGWASFQIEKTKSQILQDIRILLNYFSLARDQGYLNPTNFLILYNEYDTIRNDIMPSIVLNDNIKILPVKLKALEKKEFLTERQKKIMEFLQEHEKAQVMDLEKVLYGVTKRTIRRDLDELLKINEVVRFGKFNQIFYKKR